MRITLELGLDGTVRLPFSYNQILQAFLYQHISDRDYQSFIHDEGYRLGEKQFKLFTFSRLIGQFQIDLPRKEIVFNSPLLIIIAAAVEPFITDLAETLMKTEHCRLGSNSMQIRSIAVHKVPQFEDKVRIRMLSPMTAYATIHEGQQKRTEYYSPWKEPFAELVYRNLAGKYEALYGEKPPLQSFALKPIGTQEKKMKTITSYKGTIIEAYQGIYDLQGHPEIIKVAYNTGLGGKNAQGFGCWEVV